METAFDLYMRVKALPGTTTRMVFSAELKLSVNGEAFSDKLNLLSAVDDSGNLLIVKILTIKDDPSSRDSRLMELSRELRAVRLLNLERPLVAFVTSRVVSVTVHDKPVDAIVMPRYSASLRHLPKLHYSLIDCQGRRILEAVRFMHEQGLAHMDIKGDNIFCDMGGMWYLGDFGSSCLLPTAENKETVISTTMLFYSSDVRGKEPSVRCDFYMLLVALVIECLPDKHKWSGHLSSPTSQFIDDKKLRSAVAEYGDLVPLLSAMLEFIEWAPEL
jgi:serine/threonine protein kinase